LLPGYILGKFMAVEVAFLSFLSVLTVATMTVSDRRWNGLDGLFP
jgi:hypothetical protein